MKESDLISWYKKHSEVLKTFDLDKDGRYSFHEIRWAVKTTLDWAERAQSAADAEQWYYAESGKVHGPVSWFWLEDRHRSKPVRFIKLEQSPYWLPYIVVARITKEGIESEEEETKERDVSSVASAGYSGCGDEDEPVEPSGETAEYFHRKYEHIWEEQQYILETVTVQRGSMTGVLYNMDRKMLLRIKPDAESEHIFPRFFRMLGPRGYSSGYGGRYRYGGSRYITANSLYIETPTGEKVYRLKREYWAWLIPYKTEVYDLTNPELGQLYESSLTHYSLGFYSWGSIDRGETKLSIRVSGTFWQYDFMQGKRHLATVLRKLPKGMEWVSKPRQIYVIEMHDHHFSPASIIHYILSLKRTFWRLDAYLRS